MALFQIATYTLENVPLEKSMLKCFYGPFFLPLNPSNQVQYVS